ncbi:hypothetical protein DMC30DRAFT_403553 [Rhodotorula diobovata]|uniref:Uncharacterized protein n=1 Tax=Rhodotorula diobovata TaxID=5288 RepID=A0A5C5FNS5_9BASI|nr:hypothetical protein DMC30DRAFT_403553 [Rhodotorula diobovata]
MLPRTFTVVPAVLTLSYCPACCACTWLAPTLRRTRRMHQWDSQCCQSVCDATANPPADKCTRTNALKALSRRAKHVEQLDQQDQFSGRMYISCRT